MNRRARLSLRLSDKYLPYINLVRSGCCSIRRRSLPISAAGAADIVCGRCRTKRYGFSPALTYVPSRLNVASLPVQRICNSLSVMGQKVAWNKKRCNKRKNFPLLI